MNKQVMSYISYAATASIGVVFGLVSMVIGEGSRGNLFKAMVFPLVLLIPLIYVFSIDALYVLIIGTRATIDPLIVESKIGPIGIGAIISLAVISMAIFKYNRIQQAIRSKYAIPFLIFAIYSLLVVFYSDDKIEALKYYVNLIACGAIFFLGLGYVRNRADYKRWLYILLLSTIIPIAYALFTKVAGLNYFVESEPGRIQGLFYHPNVLAFYCVLYISVAFYLFKRDDGQNKMLQKTALSIYILILITVLLLTKTRSAWVACFVVTLLYGLIFDKKYIFYCVLITGVAFLIPDIRDRIQDAQEGKAVWGYGTLNSYTWRKMIWAAGLEWMEPSRYAFGYGYESFLNHSREFFKLSNMDTGSGAHNIYVQLIFETGILGLLTFVILIGNLLRRARASGYLKAKDKLLVFIVTSLIIAYCIFGYSDNMFSYLSFNWSFWMFLGLSFAVIEIEDNSMTVQVKNVGET